jgi:hypothetical protein
MPDRRPEPQFRYLTAVVRALASPSPTDRRGLEGHFAAVLGSAITDVTFFSPKAVARERGHFGRGHTRLGGSDEHFTFRLESCAAQVATRVRWNIFLLMLKLVSISYIDRASLSVAMH